MITHSEECTISNGQTISNAVPMDREYIVGLEIPTITTAILYLLVAMEESGTFRRLLKADGSGDWNIASGTGNKMIFIDEAAPFNFVKVESSETQGAERVFVFHTRE